MDRVAWGVSEAICHRGFRPRPQVMHARTSRRPEQRGLPNPPGVPHAAQGTHLDAARVQCSEQAVHLRVRIAGWLGRVRAISYLWLRHVVRPSQSGAPKIISQVARVAERIGWKAGGGGATREGPRGWAEVGSHSIRPQRIDVEHYDLW